MSYIKDIGESHVVVKSLVISLILMPLWYISIFFLNHEFYLKVDFTILSIISFIISVTSFVMVTTLIDDREPTTTPEENIANNTAISVIVLWFWKLLLFFLVYTASFLLKGRIYFYFYILIYFAPILIGLIVKWIREGYSQNDH